jgi:hypothetical protein
MGYNAVDNFTDFSSNVSIYGNLGFTGTINGIFASQLNTLIDIAQTYTIETRLYNIENNMAVFYSPFFAFLTTPSPTGYDIYYNCGHMFLGAYITFSTSINGISSTVFNYLANVTSDIQTQFNNIGSSINSINTKLTGIGYNSGNDYTDITNNVSVYGNFGFTGTINAIPRATFMFIQNVTSDIQIQFNSINTSINNILTSISSILTSISSINTDLSNNYVDKTTTQTITGTKTFTNLNASLISTGNLNLTNLTNTFQKKTLYLSNTNEISYGPSYPLPVSYSSATATINNDLPNFTPVNIYTGCSQLTIPYLDNTNTENWGKSFIICNKSGGNVTINAGANTYFIGLCGDCRVFNLPPYARAIITSTQYHFWDIIYISSFYDWKPGVIILGAYGSFNSTINVSYSSPDLRNLFNQTDGLTSVALGSFDRQNYGEAIAGTYDYMNVNADMDGAVVYPNWGVVAYNDLNYTGTVLLNFKNSTKNPICVKCSSINAASSIKIYYLDNELVNL